ncbi:MAG: peptidoglycan-binding protein LysM [Rhodothermales bacterium]|jgi:nucleoid-associated protein YgaU
MGAFDFLKDIGRAIVGDPAADIRESIEKELAGQVEDLTVSVGDGRATLLGKCKSDAAREKAILLAGNVKGIEKVEARFLTVEVQKPPEPTFYTVQSGDSLSKIAKHVYGDAMKWKALFEANREVIKDPDLIYPGQKIRIPDGV